MDRDELLRQLTEDVLAYVMDGSIPKSTVAERIKPDQLDQRFNDWATLVDLHFILKPEVTTFVQELPTHLRSLKTDTRSTAQTTRGAVNGRVNWSQTTRTRLSESPGDTSLFVCETRTEDYDTDENLVLKHLLSVIHRTLQSAEEYLDREYGWMEQTWTDERDLVTELRRIVERNVHVRRIRPPAQYEPTDRMLAAADASRHEVYRAAAHLVRDRRRARRGDAGAIRELLDTTAITPDDEDTLLELFVLFRMIATLENLQDDAFELETISAGRQEVARLIGEKELVLYHDNSADDRGLSFRTGIPDHVPDEELGRTEIVQRVAHRVAEEYFHREFRDHTGRPDVIVLEVISADRSEYEYLVVEVKNSTRKDTIRTGIRETLEYLAFLRIDEKFVFGSEETEPYFGDGWNGLLVVQDLADEDTAPISEQETIRILQASELETELQTILREIV